MQYNRVEICGVNTKELPLLKNEEKDELEMIRNENKLKKKNYMIKNENKLLKVISVDTDNIDLIEEGNESGSDSEGSKGSKKSNPKQDTNTVEGK